MTKPGHFQWTEESDSAFVATKQAVVEQVTTTFLAINADYSLAVDASDIAVGAVLQQRLNGDSEWQPLAFFSCN